ncbi:MAG TPA: IniB N-terminal domain-containing protein [Pseudonocardiaceae bacterium]|jgi:hypothetical protein|nr:IniB N-terminal domain-containing protein [Pseudonocardiaceae bacterium]
MALEQSLHHFVFQLVSDPDQLAAFQSDPAGALSAAGLSDINADDVRDVLPLVADNLPATSGLESLLSELPSSGEATSGIEQLQAVAYAVSSQVAGSDFGPADLTGPLSSGLSDPAAALGDLSSLAPTDALSGAVGSLPNPTTGLETVNEQVTWAIGAVSDTTSTLVNADSTGTLASLSEAGSTIASATTGFTSVSDVAETLDSEALSNATALTSVAESTLADPAGSFTTLAADVQQFATSSLTVDHGFAVAGDLNSDGVTVASQVQPVVDDLAAGHAPLDDALNTAHSLAITDSATLTDQLGISNLIAGDPALSAGHTALTNTINAVESHLPLDTVGTTVHNAQTTVNGVLEGTGVSDAISHSPLASASTTGPAVAGELSSDATHVTDTVHDVVTGLDLHLPGQ